MGTINDLVNSTMLQPLKGARNQRPRPISPVTLPEDTTPVQAQEMQAQPSVPYHASSDIRANDMPPAPDTSGDLESLKNNLSQSQAKIDDFMNQLGSHAYEYKDKKDGEGTFVSPMAQEFEKSEIGKSAVIDTPEGKKVDYARLVGTELAALASQNTQIKDLQSQIDAMSALREFTDKKKVALEPSGRKKGPEAGGFGGGSSGGGATMKGFPQAAGKNRDQ